MAWEQLKQQVSQTITTNGNNEITGAKHRDLLNNDIIPALGSLRFGGGIDTNSVPEVADFDMWYITEETGIYTAFGNTSATAGGILYGQTGTWQFIPIRDAGGDLAQNEINIEGNTFTYRPLPNNTTGTLQPGDLAVMGWMSQTQFGKILSYSGDAGLALNSSFFTDWDIIEMI